MADLPPANIHGERPRLRVVAKYAVIAFAALSIVGVGQMLLAYTIYYPPLGLLFDIAWLGPLILPLVRKRVGPGIAVLCLAGFGGQALVFDLPEALARIAELRVLEQVAAVGITGGLLASVVAIFKPDPDPDFVPNEFTLN